MTNKDAVTFTLPSGARVTAPKALARRLGWKPEPESQPDEKPRTVKRSPRKRS